jgi:hypothetical protein
VAAGETKWFVAVIGDQPVAAFMRDIGAISVRRAAIGKSAPLLARGFKGGERRQIRQIA